MTKSRFSANLQAEFASTEFHLVIYEGILYAELKILSISVSVSPSNGNSLRKLEKRSKGYPSWFWDTRYTVRTCVRTPSGRGPRTCVHSRVPTFIHSNTHRPRCTPQRGREKEGTGLSEGGRGEGDGGTERVREISAGSKETGDERDKEEGGPSPTPACPHRFSRPGRGTSRHFSASRFYIRTSGAQLEYLRSYVISHLMTDDGILRRRTSKNIRIDALCDAPFVTYIKSTDAMWKN